MLRGCWLCSFKPSLGDLGRWRALRPPSALCWPEGRGFLSWAWGVKEDYGKVLACLGVRKECPQLVELKQLGIGRGINVRGGLHALAQKVLGMPPWKTKGLTMSKWNEVATEPWTGGVCCPGCLRLGGFV